MYLYQETYHVTPGLQTLIDARVRSLHEQEATNAAFLASDWMKYQGNDTTDLAFRLWRDRDVAFDDQHARWMAEYNRSRPQDAFVQPPDIEFFDPISQIGATGGASFLVRSDFNVGGRAFGAWQQWERGLSDRLLDTQGFREIRLYRFMGGESRYFRAEFWDSAEAASRFWTSAEARSLVAALPAPAFRRPPQVGYFAVLQQLGDPRIA
jgi:heme-degrading monooxygenase HmoA